MKLKYYIFIIILITISGIETLFGQEQFQISMFQFHQPFINPATITSYKDINAALFHRTQWASFGSNTNPNGDFTTPRTQFLNANMPLSDNTNYVGLTIMNDVVGVNQLMNISAIYAYKAQLDKTKFFSLSLAPSIELLQGSYSQVKLEMEDVASDPLFTGDSPNLYLPNFKFGAYYYTPEFYAGIAIPQMLNSSIQKVGTAYQGNTTVDPSNFHYYLTAGAVLEYNEKYTLKPAVLIKQVADAPITVDALLEGRLLDKIGAAVSYNTSKVITGMFDVNPYSYLRIAYSYGFNFGKIRSYQGGNHEIMLIYVVNNRRKVKMNMPKLLEEYKKAAEKSQGKSKSSKPAGRQPYSGG